MMAFGANPLVRIVHLCLTTRTTTLSLMPQKFFASSKGTGGSAIAEETFSSSQEKSLIGSVRRSLR